MAAVIGSHSKLACPISVPTLERLRIVVPSLICPYSVRTWNGIQLYLIRS